jgi:phage baseplate assembly protein W
MISDNKNIYGSLPSKAAKRQIASQNKFLMGISYPFAQSRTKRVLGDVQKVSNVDYFAKSVDKELIRGMLRQLFLTRKGERVMNSSFGLNLDDYAFSPLDITTFEILRADITTQISIFVPFFEIIKLGIFESDPTIAENGLVVKLTGQIRSNNLIDPFEVEVNIG